jgi:hypothetical protein
MGEENCWLMPVCLCLQENIYCDDVDEVDGLTCCLAEAIGDNLEVHYHNEWPSDM